MTIQSIVMVTVENRAIVQTNVLKGRQCNPQLGQWMQLLNVIIFFTKIIE